MTVQPYGGSADNSQQPAVFGGLWGLSSDEATQQVKVGQQQTGDIDRGATMQHGPTEAPQDTSSPLMKDALLVSKDFAAMAASSDPAERAKFKEIQQKMYVGGYLGSNKPSGHYDPKTQAGFHDVVMEAAATGQSVNDVLDEAQKGGSNGPTVNITDPRIIKTIAQHTAVQLIGHKLSAADEAKLIASVQDQERNAGKGNSTFNPTTGLNEAITPASSSLSTKDLLEQEIRDAHPQEVATTELADRASQFMNLLASSRVQFPTSGSNTQAGY